MILKCSLIVNWSFFGFQLQQLGYAATHPVLAASDLGARESQSSDFAQRERAREEEEQQLTWWWWW
jgi:hypothetical protein